MADLELQDFLNKNRQKKIVFTNGCFDLLHVGHVEYLKQAKKMGDILIIGLNSDPSVRKLKGPSRPINSEEDRKTILMELKSVDWVEIFDEDTPINLIKIIKPNIYVKGGDYNIEKVPEYEVVKKYGGECFALKLVPGKSSSKLIEFINQHV